MSKLSIIRGPSGEWEPVPYLVSSNLNENSIMGTGNLNTKKTSISFEYQPNSELKPYLEPTNSLRGGIQQKISKHNEYVNFGENNYEKESENNIYSRSMISAASMPLRSQRQESKFISQISVTPNVVKTHNMTLPPRSRSDRFSNQFDANYKLSHEETELYEDHRDKLKNASLRRLSLPRQVESRTRRSQSHNRKFSHQPVLDSRKYSYYDNGNNFPPNGAFPGVAPFSPFQPIYPQGQFGYNTMTPMQIPSPFMMSPFPYMSSPMMIPPGVPSPGYVAYPNPADFVNMREEQHPVPRERRRSRQQHSCICCPNGHHRSRTISKFPIHQSSESDENESYNTPMEHSSPSQSPIRRRKSNNPYSKHSSSINRVGSVTTAINRGHSPLSHPNFKWIPPNIENFRKEDGYPTDYTDMTTVGIEFASDTPEYSENRIAKRKVVKMVGEALFMAPSLSSVAKSLKKEMDILYGPAWQIVVGTDTYGSNISFADGQIFHFKAYENTFLIWRT